MSPAYSLSQECDLDELGGFYGASLEMLTHAALDVLGYRYTTDAADVEELLTGLRFKHDEAVEDDFDEIDDAGTTISCSSEALTPG